MNFVHDDPEFRDLVQIVARDRGIAPGLVEKDYWVTHTLWSLLRQGFELWFKGGTSLSKGFDLILRFSEDLDLKLEPGSVSGVPTAKNWKSTAKGRSTRDGASSRRWPKRSTCPPPLWNSIWEWTRCCAVRGCAFAIQVITSATWARCSARSCCSKSATLASRRS